MKQIFIKKHWMHENSLWLLLFNLLLFGLILYASRHFILTREFYFNQFNSALPNQFENWFEIQQRSDVTWHVLLAGILVLKYGVLSLFLFTGLYLNGYTVSLRQTFSTVVTAELVFILPGILKIFWFYFVRPDFTLMEWLQFAPLSALSLTDTPISPVWVYPLNLLNVFELGYILLLAFMLHANTGFNSRLRVVISTYLPALFIWSLLIAFFSISNLPSI